MSQTEVTPDAAPETPPGMSVEDARALVAKEHGETIPANDPVLLIVTVMNACLGQMGDLHKRHEAGLSRLMADKTYGYVRGVKTATGQLAQSLSSASIEGLREVFREQDARLQAFRHKLSSLAALVAVSALVNAVVLVLMGWR
jgi:hypothetical protein